MLHAVHAASPAARSMAMRSLLAVLAITLAAGCRREPAEAEKAHAQVPHPDPATHVLWMLFGEARNAAAGVLAIKDDDQYSFTVRIGERAAIVSDGWVLSDVERQRIRKLAGSNVVAAFGVPWNGWQMVVCAARLYAIGPADAPEWAAPAAALRALEDDVEWQAHALAMERGQWGAAMDSCWRENNAAGIQDAIAHFAGETDRIALARDIVGWSTRTTQHVFPEIEKVRVRFGSTEGTVTNVREMAAAIVRNCLDVPHIKPREWNEPPGRAAKRLWILTRMWELWRDAGPESGTKR